MKTSANMTKDGIGTTLGLGGEQYEYFARKYSQGFTLRFTQYDYRHTDGRLFSCVAPTVEMARAKHDRWITGQEKRRTTSGGRQ